MDRTDLLAGTSFCSPRNRIRQEDEICGRYLKFSRLVCMLSCGMLSCYFLIPAPLLVGITFHYLLPWLNQLLLERFSFSFEEWYPLADGLMIILTPTLLTMSSAFLLLEECDEGLGSYYQITPAKQFHYLMARIGLPALWDFYVRLGLLVGLVFLSFRSPLSLPAHFSLSYSAVALQS